MVFKGGGGSKRNGGVEDGNRREWNDDSECRLIITDRGIGNGEELRRKGCYLYVHRGRRRRRRTMQKSPAIPTRRRRRTKEKEDYIPRPLFKNPPARHRGRFRGYESLSISHGSKDR